MEKLYGAKKGKSRKLRNKAKDPEVLRVGNGEIRAERNPEYVTVQLSMGVAEALRLCEVSLEEVCHEIGLLIAQSLIDAEVEAKAGPRHGRVKDRKFFRWGTEEGYIVLSGSKARITRPRIRSVSGVEGELETYRALQAPGHMQREVLGKALAGVSARKYEDAVEEFRRAYGIKKSSISRHYIRASASKLKELLERDLGGLDLVAIVIDGVEFKGHLVVVALGIDALGKKHILGIWQGATENYEVCTSLLEDLVSRGLRQEGVYLFILDGSKALKKAVRKVFSPNCPIQRCIVHKRKNVLSHLPLSYHATVRRRLNAAWRMTGYQEAKSALEDLARYLDKINPSAARSLREGMEETLTLHKLKLPHSLRKSLESTNTIESCFSGLKEFARRVKRWRGGDMVTRWVATGLLYYEKRFRRIKGWRELPRLVSALTELSEKEAGHGLVGA